jgi:N6-L-threonylcarbamoyladenine synthase
MYILGIESSCDESAASVIKSDPKTGRGRVLSNIISSQIEIHKKYGGVVPEIAAREHVLNLLPVIHEALAAAKVKPQQLKAIAITKGPGLITSLITGLETARTLAYAWHKPVIEINHLNGHIYSNFIDPQAVIKFPALILIVSGGHTILLTMDRNHKIKIVGETRDDAAGEAFDKAAKMMELGYPGGPILSRYADDYQKTGQTSSLELPRPMLNSPDFDFSFSGLKTALLYQLQKDKNWRKRVPEYCYAYQEAIVDILKHKTLKAAIKYKAKTIMLAGGVSANKALRSGLAAMIQDKVPDSNFLVPAHEYTTDNAAMIAAAAAWQITKKKPMAYHRLRVDSSLQLK